MSRAISGFKVIARIAIGAKSLHNADSNDMIYAATEAAFVYVQWESSEDSGKAIALWYRLSSTAVLLIGVAALIMSCGVLKTTCRTTASTLKATYQVSKGAAAVGIGAGKMVYRVGQFTFHVVMAPLNWPLTHESIESIGDLPPTEAIRRGSVKSSPYVVNGKRYVPMSVDQARYYHEIGTASWYGYETFHQKGGHMTANGESFDPDGFNAAHKYLPLPTFVRVRNLENNRQIIVRVNDRGPFVDGRVIDLSAGAARKLGFYKKGTARVLVESVIVEG